MSPKLLGSLPDDDMNSLFANAVLSIQLGVEDYQAQDPKRALSAARNFYAGVLLLAKEVLVRATPGAQAEQVIGARYKPTLDGDGNLRYVPDALQTIDFANIGKRFKDFGLTIDEAALKDLNKIRNEIEHLYTREPHQKVRMGIAKAFPVVADLFRLAKESPQASLGGAWDLMLEVKEVYDRELLACKATFANVEWYSPTLEDAAKICPTCSSALVEQTDVANTERQSIKARCRACDEEISAEDVAVAALEAEFEYENYVAAKDGGDPSLCDCPECGLKTYIVAEDENGCAWCEYILDDECGRCSTALTPENVSADNSGLCSYCDYVMSKDD